MASKLDMYDKPKPNNGTNNESRSIESRNVRDNFKFFHKTKIFACLFFY